MKTETPARVLVLLPVWNGAEWLAEQLDSILAQRDVQVTLLCRDDGSTDDSAAILQQYRARFPGQVLPVDDGAGNLGACGSFSRLMQSACEDHLAGEPELAIALADQDDVWHPDRLAVTLSALREADTDSSPVLVHSDLRVVDRRLQPVASSLVRYQGLQPWRQGLPAQLLSNPVTGCTVLMNAALLRRALPVPEQAVMHDWWLSLVASLYGRRVYIDRPLVDYRQHEHNAVGARAWQPPRRWGGVLQRAFDRSNQAAFEEIAGQAAALVQRHRTDLDFRALMAAGLVQRLPRLPAPAQKVAFRLLRRL